MDGKPVNHNELFKIIKRAPAGARILLAYNDYNNVRVALNYFKNFGEVDTVTSKIKLKNDVVLHFVTFDRQNDWQKIMGMNYWAAFLPASIGWTTYLKILTKVRSSNGEVFGVRELTW